MEFPAEPTMSMGNYRTVTIRSAPVQIFSVKEDHAVYVASVVELMDRKEEGASLLGEAEFNLSMLGDVSNSSVSRVGPGGNAVWGHFVTVDCRKAKIPDQPGQGDAARNWFKGQHGDRMRGWYATHREHVLPSRTPLPDSWNQSSESRRHIDRSIRIAICKFCELLRRGRLAAAIRILVDGMVE